MQLINIDDLTAASVIVFVYRPMQIIAHPLSKRLQRAWGAGGRRQ